MHAAARAFVERWVRPDRDDPVIEIGSRNVNGGLRDLFPRAPQLQTYVGLDILPGPGVDIVADAATWEPAELAECVICCEVLEHAQNWRGILMNACAWLAPGGRLIVTCAGAGRKPHSAIDGEALRPEEHYQNLMMWEVVPCISEVPGMRILVSEYDPQGCDVRVVAERGSKQSRLMIWNSPDAVRFGVEEARP